MVGSFDIMQQPSLPQQPHCVCLHSHLSGVAEQAQLAVPVAAGHARVGDKQRVACGGGGGGDGGERGECESGRWVCDGFAGEREQECERMSGVCFCGSGELVMSALVEK